LSVKDNVLLISIVLIGISIGMIYVEEINLQHSRDTGRYFVDYELTPFVKYSELSIIGTNREEFNETTNEIGEFQKPTDVGFDFWFFQSINILGLFVSALINTVFGAPYLLTTIGFPPFLATGLVVAMGIGFFLMLIYLIIGKFG